MSRLYDIHIRVCISRDVISWKSTKESYIAFSNVTIEFIARYEASNQEI